CNPCRARTRASRCRSRLQTVGAGYSSEPVGKTKQGLKRKVGSIARPGKDHRPTPEVEGHYRGSFQKILDPSAEKDGNSEGAVVAEGHEQREIHIEGDV